MIKSLFVFLYTYNCATRPYDCIVSIIKFTVLINYCRLGNTITHYFRTRKKHLTNYNIMQFVVFSFDRFTSRLYCTNWNHIYDALATRGYPIRVVTWFWEPSISIGVRFAMKTRKLNKHFPRISPVVHYVSRSVRAGLAANRSGVINRVIH